MMKSDNTSLLRQAARVTFPALALAASLSLHAATVMNIEIDYMEVPGGHSHKPQPDEIAAVVQMFACHDITLNIVVDQAIPHYDVMPLDPDDSNNFFGYYGDVASFGLQRLMFFNHQGVPGWHYCIFGHQYMDTDGTASKSSGVAERPGGNFVVTLGAFLHGQIGTGFERAATLAHEFGHNLNLVHGASGDSQPNKPSIMSYFYQLRGVRTTLLNAGLTTEETGLFKEMDYSDGTMCSLNESALNEQFGSGMVSVDWNCNGIISGTASRGIDDSDDWCTSPSMSRDVLPDINEWASLLDMTYITYALPPTLQPEIIRCITAEESKAYQNAFSSLLPQPTVSSEPCISEKMIYLTAGAVPAGTGTGANPFTTLNQAQTAATTGSHLFCLPGTYTVDAGPVHLNKPMTIFCNIGSAVLSAH